MVETKHVSIVVVFVKVFTNTNTLHRPEKQTGSITTIALNKYQHYNKFFFLSYL